MSVYLALRLKKWLLLEEDDKAELELKAFLRNSLKSYAAAESYAIVRYFHGKIYLNCCMSNYYCINHDILMNEFISRSFAVCDQRRSRFAMPSISRNGHLS